ncbi:MAG: phospholipase D family protein [Moraxella sp.]|nr:phospholipase D family protein [Moraxella sp.]
MTKHTVWRWLALGWAGLLGACQTLPSTPHLADSIALTHKAQTLTITQRHPVFEQLHHTAKQHPNLSGYRLIASGADALLLRHELTQMASHSIDIQYYIWHADEAGVALLKELWHMANQGVMVRLLLDDFNSTSTLDQLLLDFNAHPNIAVRLANPMVYRRFKRLNFLTIPVHANTRMHNKSMTFDRQISIIGGRNIGNEYLNSHPKNNFADLDVLVVGQSVADIHDSFEKYWQSPDVFDITVLAKPDARPSSFEWTKDDKHRYQQAISDGTPHLNPRNGQLPLRWRAVKFLADDPKKLANNAQDLELLVEQLRQTIGQPKHHLSIISSYFVPTKQGVALLSELVKRGVKVSILTNAYSATDVRSVHSGYGHWRKALIKAGISLYESKPNAINTNENHANTTMSLHAKAFAVDDHQVFIGSYNIDPRSANTNSELGVVIDDATLAWHFHHALNNLDTPNPTLLQQAYKVELDDKQRLRWRTLENGQEVIYRKEPNMTWLQKSNVALLSILPIDGLL